MKLLDKIPKPKLDLDAHQVPPVGLTLPQCIEKIREVFETDPNSTRPFMSVFFKKTPEGKYAPMGIIGGPEISDPREALFGIALTFRFKGDETDAVLMVLDVWGLCPPLMDELRKKLTDAAESAPDPLAAEEAKRKVIDEQTPPIELPREQRVEWSLYIALSKDGEFHLARQDRGLEHELCWLDSDPDLQLMGYGADSLSMELRRIVEEAN